MFRTETQQWSKGEQEWPKHLLLPSVCTMCLPDHVYTAQCAFSPQEQKKQRQLKFQTLDSGSGVYLTYQRGLGLQVLPASYSPYLLQGRPLPSTLNFSAQNLGCPSPEALPCIIQTVWLPKAFLLYPLYLWPPGCLIPLSPLPFPFPLDSGYDKSERPLMCVFLAVLSHIL